MVYPACAGYRADGMLEVELGYGALKVERTVTGVYPG